MHHQRAVLPNERRFLFVRIQTPQARLAVLAVWRTGNAHARFYLWQACCLQRKTRDLAVVAPSTRNRSALINSVAHMGGFMAGREPARHVYRD